MNYNPNYPLKHLSVRVPWHDNKWNGTICTNPLQNSACLNLEKCAQDRDDNYETQMAGMSLKVLNNENKKLPPCIGERATFMSSDAIEIKKTHPYSNNSGESIYNSLHPARLTYDAYSAAAIPFYWLNGSHSKEKSKIYDIDYQLIREPWAQFDGKKYNFTKKWIQERTNQKALLDCFFSHLETKKSLVIFYAKEVPFVETHERIIIGLGFVEKLRQNASYPSDIDFSSMMWEHTVHHSIRKENKNGFLIPYHEAIEYQKAHPDFNPEILAVKIPTEYKFQFSYGSEHVSNDALLWVLREVKKKMEIAKKLNIGNNLEEALDWIQKREAETEKLRGDYPGLGAALYAFGVEKGYYLAQKLIQEAGETKDAWDILDEWVKQKNSILNEFLFGDKLEHYQILSRGHRKKFLQTLSRFDLTFTQCKILFSEKNKKAYLPFDEKTSIENPYILYEVSINSVEPISFYTIDNGLMLNRDKALYPLKDKRYIVDSKERVRGLIVQELEKGLLEGHTVLSEKILKERISTLPLEPPFELTTEAYELAKSIFEPKIHSFKTKDKGYICQLQRILNCGDEIRRTIKFRLSKAKYPSNQNWENELLGYFREKEIEVVRGNQNEEEGIKEKVSGLKELYSSPFSVLIGSAGTGKTTLLNIFCNNQFIKQKGVIILTPTGKSRVRVEALAQDASIKVNTIAQFLVRKGRYRGRSMRYQLNDEAKETAYKTLIIDEASMLTEEMLAATFNAFEGLERIILVGDPRQLPPIGGGRPFVDIINFIKPKRTNIFPKVEHGYIELTRGFRSVGRDIEFANLFTDNTEEQTVHEFVDKSDNKLGFYNWDEEINFSNVLDDIMEKEFNVKDAISFNRLQGGNSEGKNFKKIISTPSIEEWQLLSPVKGHVHGTVAINRYFHEKYRKSKVYEFKGAYWKPNPLGTNEIVYGDKVICIQNLRDKDAYPAKQKNFIANGEVGLVVGYQNGFVNVEFSGQIGYTYGFTNRDFSEDLEPLELAYALTVHKAQGSQFGKTLIIIPNPCFNLSRELIYTALTRQQKKVIVLYQGTANILADLTNKKHSDTYKRLTRLFFEPKINLLKEKTSFTYIDSNHIHCASDGTMVISKSELIIYQTLLDCGLQPQYELQLKLIGRTVKPDFTIQHDGEVYYWEHLGMLTNPNYKKKWNLKLELYKDNDIFPYDEGGNLIITDDSKNKGLSIKKIRKLITDIFEKKIAKDKKKNVKRMVEAPRLINGVMSREVLKFEGIRKDFEGFLRQMKRTTLEIDEKLLTINKKLDSGFSKSTDKDYAKEILRNVPKYEKLIPFAQNLLEDAYYIYNSLGESPARMYDTFILQHIRCLENDMLERVFAPYVTHINNEKGDELAAFLENEWTINNVKLFASRVKKNDTKFELGTMHFVLNLIHKPNGNTLSASKLLQNFRAYVLNILNESFLDKNRLKVLDTLIKEYRNGAAHSRTFKEEEAKQYKKISENFLNEYLTAII